jgi:uncharacterized protein YndB with AHSA1/START domain
MSEQAAADRRGVVTTEPDGRQRLEFRRSWPDPVEDVWAALTEPDRAARWIGRYEGERRPGGRGTLAMTHEGEGPAQAMSIAECDPPHRLVVETSAGEEQWRLEVDLLSADGGTELVFRQWFASDADVRDYAGGWHWYLDKLDTEISGRPAPAEWEAFWAEVGPGYGVSPEPS